MAELDAELQQAVENEDYEKASLLRDEIRKRK
jgi:protein-arginine kinase activator protein McsA